MARPVQFSVLGVFQGEQSLDHHVTEENRDEGRTSLEQNPANLFLE
ncbi:MAG: hypothetical protein ACE5R6_18100 [Candidatus Heimdallarchaeota archaeon]